MADIVEDAEMGEQLLVVAVVIFGGYLIYEVLNKIAGAAGMNVWDLLSGKAGKLGQGTPGAPAKGFADGGVMTPAVASSLGKILFVAPGGTFDVDGTLIPETAATDRSSYQLSADGLQLWFPDGSYYDNTTGHLYLKDGTDQGMAF
jgi:hypothetical protein